VFVGNGHNVVGAKFPKQVEVAGLQEPCTERQALRAVMVSRHEDNRQLAVERESCNDFVQQLYGICGRNSPIVNVACNQKNIGAFISRNSYKLIKDVRLILEQGLTVKRSSKVQICRVQDSHQFLQVFE
jgi:hypothetical protein